VGGRRQKRDKKAQDRIRILPLRNLKNADEMSRQEDRKEGRGEPGRRAVQSQG
jgi:hypothetical protein